MLTKNAAWKQKAKTGMPIFSKLITSCYQQSTSPHTGRLCVVHISWLKNVVSQTMSPNLHLHDSPYLPAIFSGALQISRTVGFPGGASGKESACQYKRQVQSLGQEDPLEEEMATHSNILAWRIAWTEEPGGLQSVGSQRVRHNWKSIHTHTFLGACVPFKAIKCQTDNLCR